MLLFHQLEEQYQHKAINLCMQLTIEDLLSDGVQIEAFSDEDKKIKVVLELAVADCLTKPEEERFDFLVNHKEAGIVIYNIAVDMARATYYHPDEDFVITYEDLRAWDEDGEEDLDDEELMAAPEKKSDHLLN